MKKAKSIFTMVLIVGCLCRTVCPAQEIKVIRDEGESRSVIYTGPPDGYLSGCFSGLDFEDKDFYVILDWDTDEVIYIYPIEQEQSDMEGMTGVDFIQQTDRLDNVNNINTAMSDNTVVAVSEVESESGFLAEFNIHNGNETQKTVRLVGASYKNGQMTDVNSKTVIVQPGCDYDDIITIEKSNNQVDFFKFFAWSEDMKPLCDAVVMQNTPVDKANEIFEGVRKRLEEDKRYLFLPKRNGVYSFLGASDMTLYKNAFGGVSEIDADSMLFYPDVYYIEVGSESDVKIEYTQSKTNPQAFLTGEYFSDMSDSGSLYKGNTLVYASLARWIFGGENVYFNSNGLKKTDTTTNETVSVLDGVNPYFIVSDGDSVYFSDKNNGGRICKYQNGELVTVCMDSAAWLDISGEYIYYKNLLDGGKMYRIEKNADNALCGELAE